MATTPFIRPIPTQGGAFYTFTSAGEDLTLTFSQSTTKFAFSKFVLLNIPDVKTSPSGENTLQFGAIQGALNSVMSNSQNNNFADSFQNYCLNLESALTSVASTEDVDGYDPSLLQTVSERVFWKWLKELGAIRYRNAISGESDLQKRFVEEDDSETYQRVVKYIGSVDVVNSVKSQTNAYTELYCHIPAKDGSTPVVLFDTLEDQNYKSNMTITNHPLNPLDNAYLTGRHYEDVHPAGLSIEAFFDLNNVATWTLTNTNGTTAQSTWMAPRVEANSYFTENLFGLTNNERWTKSVGPKTVTHTRSKMDGAMIDFSPDSYSLVNASRDYKTVEQTNVSPSSKDFEFNTILLYYDLLDPVTNKKATNLYGVFFLDNVEINGLDYAMPRFEKLIPDKVTGNNGNSYSFKLNVKFDTSVTNVGLERAVNEYNTFSMNVFMEAFSIIQGASKDMEGFAKDFTDLKQKYNDIQLLVLDDASKEDLVNRMSAIEKSVTAAGAMFDSSDSIIKMIQKVQRELDAIARGEGTVRLSFDSSIVRQGAGIQIEKVSDLGSVIKINNTVQPYSVTEKYKDNWINGIELTMKPYGNYFKHFADGQIQITTHNIDIILDNRSYGWKVGQSCRLVIQDAIDLGTRVGFAFSIYTYDKDKKKKLITSFSNTEFEESNDRPIFDIVCTDIATLTFEVDKIR